jgi:hypothetical protein
VDLDAVRRAFDEQVRREPGRGDPDAVVEREPHVVRVLRPGGGWSGVVWSDLRRVGPDAAIAAELARFAGWGGPWEWKHYSYDHPVDLPARLWAAGLVAEPEEALLVAEIAELDRQPAPPDGVVLRPVIDPAGVTDLLRVHHMVFGGDHAGLARGLGAGLAQGPPTVAATVALAGGLAIAAGRVEFHTGTPFASLWGGGTVAEWRARGVFRALVAQRAALAADAGFTFLQVDASPESRPILERLGFHRLASTTPFVLPGPGHQPVP